MKILRWVLVILLLAAVTFQAVFRKQLEKGRDNEITLFRFFGGCSDEYGSTLELPPAASECAVIQVLTNRFNAENRLGIRVVTQTAEWSGYYDRLSAAFAAHRPPEIAVMHRSVFADFSRRGLLESLSHDLSLHGVEWSDFEESAVQGLGEDHELYAMPYDFHGLLWHINLDLLTRAGLVTENGEPVLPQTPDELMTQARQVKDKTGKHYFAIPSQTDPMPTWTWESWVWQQGSDLISSDLRHSSVATPAAQKALKFLSSLYEQGAANPSQDYAAAEQAFLDGKAAVLMNGTWVVDAYFKKSRKSESELKRYRAFTPPSLFRRGASEAAWTDSHVWVLPRGSAIADNPKKREAALEFLAFLYKNNLEWARTGHLPVRKSVLQGSAFLSLPERSHYASLAKIARRLPPAPNQRALQDELVQQVNSTWLSGQTPQDALARAQKRTQEILDRAVGH
ncbi:MAG: extracellular solute-binding protein [Bdellovibrionia bacterium]